MRSAAQVGPETSGAGGGGAAAPAAAEGGPQAPGAGGAAAPTAATGGAQPQPALPGGGPEILPLVPGGGFGFPNPLNSPAAVNNAAPPLTPVAPGSPLGLSPLGLGVVPLQANDPNCACLSDPTLRVDQRNVDGQRAQFALSSRRRRLHQPLSRVVDLCRYTAAPSRAHWQSEHQFLHSLVVKFEPSLRFSLRKRLRNGSARSSVHQSQQRRYPVEHPTRLRVSEPVTAADKPADSGILH